MLRVQDAVLVLACRVDNLGRKVLALVLDHLAKRVLDRGVVAVDEVTVHEPHRQRRLACLIHLCQLCLHPTLAEANSNIERGISTNQYSPTERLPTMATFLCLGEGMVEQRPVAIAHAGRESEWNKRRAVGETAAWFGAG